MKEKFLSLKEAAQMLGVKEREVLNLIKQGRLSAFRLGGKFLRFRLSQLEGIKERPARRRHFLDDENSSLFERIRDFFYFNSFYIFASLVAFLLLLVIFLW